MDNIEERRRFTRLKAYHLAKYRLADEPGGQLSVVSIKDISGGGIRLVLDKKLLHGAVLQLFILFPRVNRTVTSLVKVVWVKKLDGKPVMYEAGGEFVEIEEEFRQAIITRISLVKELSGEKNTKPSQG